MTDKILTAFNTWKRQIQNNVVDLIGDSRAAMAWVSVTPGTPNAGGGATTLGLQAFHPLNWLNMLNGNPITLGLCFANPGKRTDEYIPQFKTARLASKAGWSWYNFPFVNDLAAAQTGYTDNDGNAVTTANVALLAFNRLKTEWELDLAAGKKVVIMTEPGATNLNAAAVAALHELNLRMKCYAEANPYVTLIDMTPIVWQPTQSASAIRFRTNYAQIGDPTHWSGFGCYQMAISPPMTNWLARNFQTRDKAVASATDVYTTNPRQIIRQPFQLAASGGTTGTNVTVSSGTVPGNLKIQTLLNTAASVAITTTDTVSGDTSSGKDVTWAITFTAAGIFSIIADSPSTSYWGVTSLIEAGVNVDVAANASGANVYGDLQINSNLGSDDAWMLYAPRNISIGPTTAYSLQLKSEISTARAGSGTTGYIAPTVSVAGDIGTTITITTRRWWGYLRY